MKRLNPGRNFSPFCKLGLERGSGAPTVNQARRQRVSLLTAQIEGVRF